MTDSASPEQLLFASTANSFLEKEASLSRLRELHAAGTSFEADWWRRAAELGWTSLLVPEDLGGGSVSGCASNVDVSRNVIAKLVMALSARQGMSCGQCNLAGEQLPARSRFGMRRLDTAIALCSSLTCSVKRKCKSGVERPHSKEMLKRIAQGAHGEGIVYPCLTRRQLLLRRRLRMAGAVARLVGGEHFVHHLDAAAGGHSGDQ